MTILVVENDDDVRETTLDMIGSAGFSAVGVSDAERAVDILKSDETVDVLFSDIVLAGDCDGIDLARHATRQWPGLQVLLTSSLWCSLEPLEVAPAGWHVLTKPYRQADLGDALHRLPGERVSSTV